MKILLPKNEEGQKKLDELVVEGKVERVRYCVCYRCGTGAHERKNLFRVGKAKDNQTVYACQDHRGPMGMIR